MAASICVFTASRLKLAPLCIGRNSMAVIMSRVYVRGPQSSTYIDVPYADIRYPPVSLFEIKAARAVLRAQGRHRIAQHQIFQAIEAQTSPPAEAPMATTGNFTIFHPKICPEWVLAACAHPWAG
jgi:hypothetical protein